MKYKLAATAFFLLLIVYGYGQNPDSLLARYITNLRSFYELNPLEKCFLHTDKDFYQPGETVWFKTYLTLNGKTPSLSNVVYTDLTAPSGAILHKSMWQATKNTAEGSVYLPDTIQTGIYRIRAYSLWMLNEPQTINEQFIFILGKKDQSKTYYTPETELKVDFFPEGGNFINSVTNRIGFRVTDANKMPVGNVKVLLTDESKQTIASPLIFENGIGMFEFIPEAGKKYQLQVIRNLNNQKYFSLPPAANSGINLVVSNLSATKVFIQANADELFINKNKAVYILAQQNGNTVFIKKFNLEEAQNAAVVNKKDLAAGLMQVTAFDERMNPLAERWVWVTIPSNPEINLATDIVSVEPKGRNKYTIVFTGKDTPDISVTVIPADLPPCDFIQNQNIKTYQQFHSNNSNSSFGTNVFSPADNTKENIYLDAVILTLIPGRFTWEQIKENKQNKIGYFFETGISIRGSLQKEKSNLQFDSSKVDVITKGADSSTIFSTAKVDAKGNFAINDLHFRKRAAVYLQATNKEKKKRKVDFELLPGYIDTLSDKTKRPFFCPELKIYQGTQKRNESFLKNYSVSTIGKELTEIIVKGKNKKEIRLDSLNTALTSPAFRNSEYTKEPDPNFNYTSFSQLFEQEFFGFRFNRGYDRISGLDGAPASGLASGDLVSYYLDEQPISAEELTFINPNDVSLIKVNRNANLQLGQMGAGPSILIYTKSKGYRGKFGFDAKELTGYSIPFNFSNPDYLKPEFLKVEDRRTTLLWQPQVLFNDNKQATIEFYNNDYSKRFKIVIQGMDKSGNLYYLEKIIE